MKLIQALKLQSVEMEKSKYVMLEHPIFPKGVYKEGKAEGQGRLLIENSDVVQGHFLEGVFHGPAR